MKDEAKTSNLKKATGESIRRELRRIECEEQME